MATGTNKITMHSNNSYNSHSGSTSPLCSCAVSAPSYRSRVGRSAVPPGRPPGRTRTTGERVTGGIARLHGEQHLAGAGVEGRQAGRRLDGGAGVAASAQVRQTVDGATRAAPAGVRLTPARDEWKFSISRGLRRPPATSSKARRSPLIVQLDAPWSPVRREPRTRIWFSLLAGVAHRYYSPVLLSCTTHRYYSSAALVGLLARTTRRRRSPVLLVGVTARRHLSCRMAQRPPVTFGPTRPDEPFGATGSTDT